MSYNISIIGTGYVGLVTGVCFAKLGNTIICVDIDKDKIDQINKGMSPIYEKNLNDILTKYKNNITATDDYNYAINNTDITFICVGTPSKNDGSIDLTYVKESAKNIGEELKNKSDFHSIVVKSTVLPGTTSDIIKPIIEEFSNKKSGVEFGIAMNPEFLREGIAIYDFLNPDRIVIGCNYQKTLQVLKELYKDFNCPIVETSPTAAEMIKYASNSFLATKISFINEIGNVCKKLGIDTYQVAEGMGYDKRIGRAFLNSGIGWGGSCFGKDLNALLFWAEKNNLKADIIKSAIKVNENQPLLIVDILKKHISDLDGKTIGVIGLAFKPGTDDIRDSRSIPIVEKIVTEGANIKAFDPKAEDNFKNIYPNLHYCSKAEDIMDSDALIIATSWEEVNNLDFSGKIVIDGRKISNAENAKIYDGICW